MRQQAAVAELGHLALTEPVSDLFERAVSLVAGTMDSEYCKILELLADGTGLLLRAGVGWQKGLVGATKVDLGTDSQAGYTLISNGPVVVEDLRTEHRFRGPQLLCDHGVVSGMSVTIGARENPFGVLGVHSTSRRNFVDEDADFMQSVANLLAAAVARASVERSLLDSQARLSNIVGTAADAIVSVDDKLRITLFNGGAERIFGHSSQEALGQPLNMLIPDDRVAGHGERVRAFGREARTSRAMGPMRNREGMVGRRKDGGTFPAEVSISRSLEGGGVVFTAVIRDVTERLHLEAQVLASQRLDAIGQLAGGVAHDFNNMLTGIMGFAQLAQSSLPSEQPAAKDIARVIETAKHAAALTQQLLLFSRQQELVPVVLQANSVVQGIEAMLRRLLHENIDLVLSLDPELGNIRSDPVQLEQVAINLVVNASDAMQDGGTLIVATRNVRLEQRRARADVLIEAGDYIVLSVSDTGTGIDQETLDRIFEPFFTTKPRGHGTGMGLATVYGIVKKSGGYIFLDSVVNRGTTAQVYLPRVDESAGDIAQERTADEHLSNQQSSDETARGSGCILLVEDDEAVLDVVQRYLQGGGYRVLSAGDPTEALRTYAEHGGVIDLLVSDVMMPVMSGPALARHLVETQPGLKVLLMSGYEKGSRDTWPEGAGFIRKPFTQEALALKVNEVLTR